MIASKSSSQGGKGTISSSKAVSLVGTWDKQLSKMEEVMIMGLVFFQLFSLFINKSFLVGKWDANHL